MSFVRDLRVAVHSLIRTPGLAIAVVLTLSLGIGANAAIFTLVRGVLLKPLVNRDEDRLIYIRQSASGIGDENATFSVPEMGDLRASVKTLSAFGDFSTMLTGRIHRMTELFGRLAPGVTLDQAGAELRSVYSAMKKDHTEAYAQEADFQIGVKLLRDQITSGARTVLLVLLAASWLVFIIACSNVANLILARTVRREGELAVRVALGASKGALRRMLLAESLLLCAAGAALGVMSAQPMVAILARYASRFSVRALDFRVDSSLLWVGAALAIVAAVILAFVPRLPSSGTPSGLSLSSGRLRITGSTNRRQRIFAVTQIAASFVLLAGASMLITTLIALQRAQTGLDTQHVLAIDVPAMSYGKTPQQVVDFYKEAIRRIDALPGVSKTAFGSVVPWRDGGGPAAPGLQFSADGHVHAAGVEDPRAQWRVISPGFFASLGVPIVAGRDFNALDGQNNDSQSNKNEEPVVIVSQALAQRMFPNQDAVNRHVYWTDPVLQFMDGTELQKARFVAPHRIIGVTADIDDEHVVPEPTLTVYSPFDEGPMFGGRLFIHTGANPYALVPSVTRVIRTMSAYQPVEHASTLEDIRAEVLTPNRLNSLVFGVFAAVALAIAVVGVAGVLACSVSARTREFGIRLALGSEPQRLLKGVIAEGTVIAGAGILVGGAFGFVLARLAGSYFLEVKMPGALPVSVSAFVLMAVAVVASGLPAGAVARQCVRPADGS